MASRGSILRRSALSSSHAAADVAQSSGDEDDDASGSDGELDSKTPQSTQSWESSEDGDLPPDFSYPSVDSPHELVPNSAAFHAPADALPTASDVAVEQRDGPEGLRYYKYVHSSWKNGESVMLRHLSPEQAGAVNTLINHFNQATDMHGDLVFGDPIKLYHEIAHFQCHADIKDHVLAACGFRLSHEKI